MLSELRRSSDSVALLADDGAASEYDPAPRRPRLPGDLFAGSISGVASIKRLSKKWPQPFLPS